MFAGPAAAQPGDPASPARAARCAVWRGVVGGWAVLTLALLGFVRTFGANSPVSDEWAVLPAVVGESPVLPWLWEGHNGHRYPLPRLAWYALHRATGNDFRAGMVLSVLVVSGASFGLMRAARAARGRAHPADLLIPALLLHLGHWENWLIGYQVAFTLTVGLAAGAVAVLLSAGAPGPRRLTAAAGFGLLLGLCGGAGVLLAVPLAAAVAVLAVRHRAFAPIVFAAVTSAYAAGYVLNYTPSAAAEPTTLAAKVRTALEFFGNGFGRLGPLTGPASGAVVAAGLGAAAWAGRRSAVGVAALAGVGLVAAAVAVSRTGAQPGAGFSVRYGLLSAFGLVVAYLLACRSAKEWFGPRAAVAGVALAAAVVAAAVPDAVAHGRYVRHATQLMRRQAADGAAVEALTSEYVARVYAGEDTPGHRRELAGGIALCERNHFGPYRRK